MTTQPQQSNNLMIAGMVFGAPILLAFLIGASPVLITVLLYRWLTQPRIHLARSSSSASPPPRPRATRPKRRERPERRGLAVA